MANLGIPEGIPVVVIHGGPGAGCTERDTRFFDPKFYRIIAFNQRGAGRSTPAAEMKENNTQNLINDIKTIHKKTKNKKMACIWQLLGGSALSIAYGERPILKTA